MEEQNINNSVIKKTTFGRWSQVLSVITIVLVAIRFIYFWFPVQEIGAVELTVLSIALNPLAFYGSMLCLVLAIILGLVSMGRETGTMRSRGIFGLSVAVISVILFLWGRI